MKKLFLIIMVIGMGSSNLFAWEIFGDELNATQQAAEWDNESKVMTSKQDHERLEQKEDNRHKEAMYDKKATARKAKYEYKLGKIKASNEADCLYAYKGDANGLILQSAFDNKYDVEIDNTGMAKYSKGNID